MRKHVGFLTVVALALVTVAGVTSCRRQAAPPQITDVAFRLDWTPGAEHSFLYWAKEQQLFEEEDVNVTLQAGDGSTTSAKLVGNGTVDYALCSGDTALIAASAGAPIQVVAVLYSRSPMVVYSRKDRNITAPKDLEGKTYGANMKSTTYKQFLSFCHLTGVDVSKIKVLSTGGKAEDILTSAVDASGGYTYIQPVQCELAGVPVNEMFISDFGAKAYSMAIIANRNTANADTTRRVVKVALEAFQHMLSNSEETLEAYFRATPTANKEFESKKLERVVAFVNENLKTQGHVGVQTEEGWQQTQNFLRSQDLVATNITLAGFFTTEFAN
jgi:NitT/TauT family transport system substrate-binding protein